MSVYEDYKKAGYIARVALEKGCQKIHEEMSFLELVMHVEDFITGHGAGLAFPVNIAINSVAAHFTPSNSDEHVFKHGDVVKLDVGAHVNGYIGDTAATVEVGTTKYIKLIEAADTALSNAITHVIPGVSVSELGRQIETTISGFGFKPIKNLQGHSLSQYQLHAGLSIPNYQSNNKTKLEQGQVIAIEPFVTNGDGYVIDNGLSNIYRVVKKSIMTRQIFESFNNLPFSGRQLFSIYKEDTYRRISLLMSHRMIAPYFRLVEIKNGVVAQAEHSVMVTEDGFEILTNI